MPWSEPERGVTLRPGGNWPSRAAGSRPPTSGQAAHASARKGNGNVIRGNTRRDMCYPPYWLSNGQLTIVGRPFDGPEPRLPTFADLREAIA